LHTLHRRDNEDINERAGKARRLPETREETRQRQEQEEFMSDIGETMRTSGRESNSKSRKKSGSDIGDNEDSHDREYRQGSEVLHLPVVKNGV